MNATQAWKRRFLEYLEIEKNRSPKTIASYARCLDQFFAWSKIKHPQAITLDMIRRYRLFLNRPSEAHPRALSKNSQTYHSIILRAFLVFLTRQDVPVVAPDKIEVSSAPARQVDFLDANELRRLFEATSGQSLKSRRDRAILELLFSSGLRVSELTALDRDQVNLEKQEFSVRGKGNVVRVVFLSDSAASALRRYLDRRRDVDTALFVAAKDTASARITVRTVERIVKHAARKAGIVKDVHPHTLRHSFATDLLSNGADIRSVQALLGHASITTTQVYTHVVDKGLRDIHRKFHGKNLSGKS
jgi:site-specific recombinase XerD